MVGDPVDGVQSFDEGQALLKVAEAVLDTLHVGSLGCVGGPGNVGLPGPDIMVKLFRQGPVQEVGHDLVQEAVALAADLSKLCHRFIGIADLAVHVLLVLIPDPDAVVADLLQVIDDLEAGAHVGSHVVGKPAVVGLHQEGRDLGGQEIDDLLVVPDLSACRQIAPGETVDGCLQRFADQIDHTADFLADLDLRYVGVTDQVLVDILQTEGRFVGLLGNETVGQLDHLVGQRQKDCCRDHLKEDMEGGHLEGRGRNGAFQDTGQRRQHGQRHTDHCTDQVVDQVDEGRPLGVVPGVEGREQGRGRGADVDAADQEGCKVQGHEALHGQCLQNTDRSRGGLEDGAEQNAHGKAQEGVGGVEDEVLEDRGVLEGGHGAAHGMETLEEQTEAQDDLADVFGPLTLGVEHHDRTCGDADGGQGRDVQSDQDRGDGGTDVGAEDDAGGLGQIHDAGVDKAHDHDRGGRGGLDDDRDQGTDEEAHDGFSGQLFQQLLHLGAGRQVQTCAHVVHTEKEGTESAEE